MYVIQTNTSLDNDNNSKDFQSCMYKITKQTWDEFKEYILSDEDFTAKLFSGTMIGNTKPDNCKIEQIIVNDDIHLEVIIRYGNNNKLISNSKYYMVTEERFNELLR